VEFVVALSCGQWKCWESRRNKVKISRLGFLFESALLHVAFALSIGTSNVRFTAAPSACLIYICIKGNSLRKLECPARNTSKERGRIAAEAASHHSADSFVSKDGHIALFNVRENDGDDSFLKT
jgi:hypothetical protein